MVCLIADRGGSRMKIDLAKDSSAAKGIAARRGVGKVKHLETRTLWVQDQVERGRVAMRKIDGKTIPADLLTKYLSGTHMGELLDQLSFLFQWGRHKLASQLQGVFKGPSEDVDGNEQ